MLLNVDKQDDGSCLLFPRSEEKFIDFIVHKPHSKQYDSSFTLLSSPLSHSFGIVNINVAKNPYVIALLSQAYATPTKDIIIH